MAGKTMTKAPPAAPPKRRSGPSRKEIIADERKKKNAALARVRDKVATREMIGRGVSIASAGAFGALDQKVGLPTPFEKVGAGATYGVGLGVLGIFLPAKFGGAYALDVATGLLSAASDDFARNAVFQAQKKKGVKGGDPYGVAGGSPYAPGGNAHPYGGVQGYEPDDD